MKTVLKTVTAKNRLEVVSEAAEALKNGKIVALPTETVYGLGANNDLPSAVQRLIRLKNRPKGKPFTVHLADTNDLLGFSLETSRLAGKLVKRYWPGPLTIIVTPPSGTPIGLRVPGNEVTRDIIRASGVPIILPSANPAGTPPAFTAEQVIDFYDNEIELVVNDGKAKIGEPSTVVRVSGDSFSVVRTGIISEKNIIDTACLKVLFVCTGNSCRSPMAKGILEKLLSVRFSCEPSGLPYRGYLVQSAGFASHQGGKASLNAIRALDKMEIDISDHSAQQVTTGMLENADLVFAMTSAHKSSIWEKLRGCDSKVKLIDEKGMDIPDPFGGSESVYSQCASRLYSNLLEIAKSL